MVVRSVRIALALMVGLASFWYLAPRSPSFGMFASDDEIRIGRFVLSFLTTIAGVVLGSFYRELRALQAAGHRTIAQPMVFLAAMFRSVDMWLGLAGAPIVYALILQSTGGMTLPGLLVIALENGFCCLVIVNGFVGRAESGAQHSAKVAGGKDSARAQD